MRPLILPWPPSVNSYWQNRVVMPRGGRGFVQTFLTDRAKAYRANVHAAVLERFVARTEYLEGGVEASGSITEDVIRPLADRVGLPGQRILDRLADAELVVARAFAEAAELLCRLDPAIESHRAACGAFDALRWVLEGSEAHRPSAMLDSVTE